jgi:RNA-binding protein YlmH
MSERDKILRFYRASGDGDLAARLLDVAEGVLKNRKYKISEFLDPYGYSIAETIAAHYERLLLQSDGGYIGAERVKAAFVAEDFLGKPDFSLSAFKLLWDSRYYTITHRDVLGALMGLGIKREVIGDIIMNGSSCQIIVDTSIAHYISQNLGKVRTAPIQLDSIFLNDIAPREEKVKEIRSTVASLRLDVVAASGFGVSRTKMADEISTEKVKLNWQEAKSSSQPVKAGDIISMRGRGRVEICEIVGQTKKGRISILLKRFM